MGFFTQRDQGELNRQTVIEAKFREFVGQSYNSPRRAPAHDAPPPGEPPQDCAPRWRASEKDRVDGNADRMLGQMTADAIKQIDRLLVELQAHRKRLLSEAARVERDLIDYAALSQSTMQSTKIITESLTHWNRIRNASGTGEAKGHDRISAAFVQSADDNSYHTGAETKEAASAVGAIHETIEGDHSSAPHLAHNLPRVTLLAPRAERSID
jgi:hypothetical protein